MRHRFSTLADVLEYSASVNRNLMVSDYVDGGCRYTYAQFKDKCDQLSGILSTFGINADDKVAIPTGP